MDKATLISIQVGLPRHEGADDASDPMDRRWFSGFIKEPVEGPVRLGQTNLEGDGQADLKNHGGIDKAVLAYSAEHYPIWQQELGILELPHGAFGENFTISGLSEETVCIGDVYAIGGARVQVSQPRQPCWKLSRRWQIEDLAERVRQTGRTGWYLRVLEEEHVEAGMPIVLIERPLPQWTVARATEVMQRKDHPDTAQLADCRLLAQSWRETLSARFTDADR